jgi:putative transposase
MDGKGRCLDNVIVERLWWTVKYHYLYLWAFENGIELRKGLADWFAYYNQERFHQALEEMTPDEIYFKKCEELKAA